MGAQFTFAINGTTVARLEDTTLVLPVTGRSYPVLGAVAAGKGRRWLIRS